MISAKEAREKVFNLETKRGKEQLAICEKAISDALEDNQFVCTIDIYIDDCVKVYLEKKKEYKVIRYNNTKYGPCTIIRW